MDGVDELEAAWRELRTTSKPGVSLPHLAADALASGFDSPSLRELAGLGFRDELEARRLLPVVLQELGRDPDLAVDPTDPRSQVVPWAVVRTQLAPDLVHRAEQALAVVRRDLAPIAGRVGRLTLFWSGRSDDDGDPILEVGFDDEPFLGSWCGDPQEFSSGVDLPHLVQLIAASTQECIMETFQSYWPTCSLHRRGLHLPDWDSGLGDSGWPAWHCRAAPGHDVALVGGLTEAPLY
ncbi:hypothetical protein [Parafrankia sp. EUN1f]|uniref:hypothetical protein n=1 Tax=Parafrankia sp. EUN1f TaxID=102897 RepID=UPI0001C4646D|nr:hypothetical protein [Parafrankia sp. EUN1f]EFC80867.1 hypothetical protein FrEUN1fDRAFT_6011 [Parafrankia sp. EUN1f]